MTSDTPSSPNTLILEYIEVENFKSYAGKHRIGPFDDTFTAIIGPNGSGKSNILDALLFVFGKRANKIRLDRLAELIHTSAKFPSFDHASVTVIFKDVGASTCIQLSRVVYRHNSSTQYFIDEKKHTHGSVVSFLKERGVDLEHNRFLILQGEVEQIALMRPKGEREGEEGFLEYLDDLIGTNRYMDQISVSAASVDEHQDKRMGALEQMYRLGKDKDLLEAGKNAAMAYVKKENQLYFTVSVMCQIRIQEAEKNIAPQREALKELEAAHKQIDESLSELQKAIKSSVEEIEKCESIIQKADLETQKLSVDRDTYENKIQDIKIDIESIEKEEKKQAESQKKLKDEILNMKNHLEDIDRDKQIALDNQQDVEKRLEKSESELNFKTESLQKEMKPIQKERVDLLQDMAPHKTEIDELTKKIDGLSQRTSMAQQEVEQRISGLQRLISEAKIITEKQESLNCEILEIERRLSEISPNSGESLSSLERTRAQLREKHTSLAQQIDGIQRSIQNTLGDDKVTKFLSSQGIKGYHGPLRNLCSIDDTYDIAAGVSGGSLWAYHVVEDEATAQACIASLKKHEVGRGSFIVLSYQAKAFAQKILQPFTPPPHTVRLFDLIRITDSKFTPAVYFAVRDSLVAETLQVARQVGLSKRTQNRVVTRVGDVVEPSGQMTGGGQRRPQGARLQGSSASGRSMHEELSALKDALDDVTRNERILEEELLNQGQQGERLEKERSTLQLRLQSAKANLQRETLAASQNKSASTRQEAMLADANKKLHSADLQSCSDEIERLTKVKGQKMETMRASSERLQALDAKLASVGGPEYKILKESVANDRQWLNEHDYKFQELKRSEARFKSMLDAKIKELKNEEKILREKKSAEPRIAGLQKSMSNLQVLLDEVCGQMQTKRTVTVEAKERKWKLSEKVSLKRDEIREQESKKLNAESDIQAMMNEIEEKLSGVRHYQERIVQHELKLYTNIDDYGRETIAFDTAEGEIDVEAKMNHELQRFETLMSPEVIAQQNFSQHKLIAQELNDYTKRLSGEIDLAAVKRWKEKDELWREAKKVYDDIHDRTISAEDCLSRVRQERQQEFRDAFSNIRLRLKSLYQILTQGGDADLEYVDEHDPFQGINFCVRPPKKSWKQIGQLSGGEKTLASLSFIFALHHYRPTPIYIMDEIDAALDFRNVSIVAQYVSAQAIQAQFIIISLRNSMFEMANQLIGVCKVKDCTTSNALLPVMMKSNVETIYKKGPNTS